MSTVTRSLVLFVALTLGFFTFTPSTAFAQSRPVSVTDQTRTRQVIRSIERITDAAVIGLERLDLNTGNLLNRLDARGVSDDRLTNVATFYRRSATALRFRTIARINREAGRQLDVLRSRLNSELIVAELEEARDLAIARVIAAETAALEGITESLNMLVPTP